MTKASAMSAAVPGPEVALGGGSTASTRHQQAELTQKSARTLQFGTHIIGHAAKWQKPEPAVHSGNWSRMCGSASGRFMGADRGVTRAPTTSPFLFQGMTGFLTTPTGPVIQQRTIEQDGTRDCTDLRLAATHRFAKRFTKRVGTMSTTPLQAGRGDLAQGAISMSAVRTSLS